jgi:Mg2+ and Co2+ transporter CorA
MIKKYTNGAGVIWKIAISPSTDEILEIMHDMNIPDEYLEEIQTPSARPVCMDLNGTTYAVFHVPVHKKGNSSDLNYIEEEIDILIKDKTIVTICYDNIDMLNIDPVYAMDDNRKIHKPLDLWWHILTHIYKDKHRDVDSLVLQVKQLREKVFTDKEHIETISDIHRAYLAVDFPMETHGDIIESILEKHKSLPTTPVHSHITLQLQGELHRLSQKLDKLGAYIHELRDTQSTLISARQNSLIQTFTILTFIFLPINFLAALFGMNVVHMPIVNHPFAFWILSGWFAGMTILLLIFFKIRRWL